MHVGASVCVALAAWGVHCGHPTLSQRVNGDLAIASRQWQGHPCTGKEQIIWDAPGFNEAGFYTYGEGCVIHLAPYLKQWTYGVILCRVIVHEEGHQIGLGHSPDIHSIMYPNANDLIYPPCDKGGL